MDVAYHVGCRVDSIPFIHLGVPLGQNMVGVSAWSQVIERFRSRLAGWKTKRLSFGGYLTLRKSVLGGLGSYLMSIFSVPVIVI